MLKDVLFKLDVIIPFIVLLIIVAVKIIRKRRSSFSDYFVMLFMLLQLILNKLSGYLQEQHINNNWVYHFNCFMSHAIFSYYFLKFLKKKIIVYFGFAAFIAVFAARVSSKELYITFPSYSYAAASGILVMYALLFLNEIIDYLPTVRILELKEFWVITGVLTYFGSSFFIFISYNYLSRVSPKNVYILWQFHNIFLSLGCIIFLKAITCQKWILK